MADHPLTWTTAAAALVVAAQTITDPWLLTALAGAVALVTFLAPGRRLLELALVAGALGWWATLALALPGNPDDTVLVLRRSLELGPGVAFGGPLTVELLAQLATSCCRAVVGLLALCLPLRHVPGRRWHALATRLLGGRASLVAPWCHLGDALRTRTGHPLTTARRLADEYVTTAVEPTSMRWLRLPLLLTTLSVPVLAVAVAPAALPVPGVALAAVVVVGACAIGSLPGREVRRARD